MKIFFKILTASVLAVVIILSMATCDLNKDSDSDGPTHYAGAFKINKEQVWEGTYSNKLTEVYKKFAGDHVISVNVYWPDGDGNYSPAKNLGSGKIEKGLLSCEVPEPKAENLMEWDDFKFRFSEWDNTDCVPKVKGTYLRLVTAEDDWLNKETMSGTSSGTSDSLWLESIWFIYVDADCKITGTPSEGIRPGDAFYKTSENLDLTVKKGWNTLCRKQLLKGDEGIETDSITIKNPADFKWAIRPHPSAQ